MGRPSPRGFARAALSQPAARITFGASMRPEGVVTPVTRLPLRSIPSAGSRRTRAPSSFARCARSWVSPSESSMKPSFPQKLPPTTPSRLSSGTIAAMSSGVTSSDGMSETVLERHVLSKESKRRGRVGQEQVARLPERKRELRMELVVDPLEELHRLPRVETRGLVLPLGADAPGTDPRRFRRQSTLLLEEHHVAASESGQVISDGGADDAASDDDRLRALAHLHSGGSVE